jgi:hypothetical protein
MKIKRKSGPLQRPQPPLLAVKETVAAAVEWEDPPNQSDSKPKCDQSSR